MIDDRYRRDAQVCRERASNYAGRPESAFLLRAAQEFERLASERPRVATKAEDRGRPCH